MTFKQYLPSYHLQHVVEYYFHHTESFDNHSFTGLYSTPVLECMAFSFTSGASSKMQYGNKTFELTGQVHLFGQPVQPGSLSGKYTDYIVVKFKPLGISRLTGIPMYHIANEVLQAEDIFGKPLRQLYERMQEAKTTELKINLIEIFLLQQLIRKSKIKEHPCVERALGLIGQNNGNIEVKALQENTYTTRKTLERAFVTQLGILPKLYSRIIRYNFSKALIEKTAAIDWQKIVHQHGYYDQSHFINEFKTFSGKTPLEYYNNRIVLADDLSILLSPQVSLNLSASG